MEELLAALKALIDNAEAENRPLTDEEVTEAEGLRSQIDAYKKTAELRSLSNAYNTPVRTDLHVNVQGQSQNKEVRDMAKWMLTGEVSPEYRALTEGVGSAGGYLVPTTTQNKIIEKLVSFGGLFAEAYHYTSNSGEPVRWWTADDTANSGEIVPEGAAATTGADKVFGQATLDVYKYEATGDGGLPMKVSWELLEDANFDLEDFIADNFALRIQRALAVDLATGTGVGEPLGIVTPQAEFDEIASNAAGPTYAELVGAVAQLDEAYHANAKWLMKPSTWWFLVANLVDDAGRPLLQAQAQSGLGTSIPRQLLGYPVVLDSGMPAIGDDTKPIVFGDLKQSYVVREVNGFHLVRFNELYAINGYTGYMGWQRFGGTVQNLNSYVILGSQNS